MISRILNKLKKIFKQNFTNDYKLNYQDKGVINFIDVGSIGGLPEPWDANARLVKFCLNFEPNDEIKKTKDSLTYNTALWESEESRPFYIYKGFHNTGSSLFKQNFGYVEANFDTLKNEGPKMLADTWFDRSQLVRETELFCRSLDKVLEEEFPSKQFHFLKIDAQGAEFNILKGAESFLKNQCVGLHLELFRIPLYEDIALLDEVSTYLADFGFKLIKKFPPHGSFNSQHDCLFLKDNIEENITSIINKVYGLK